MESMLVHLVVGLPRRDGGSPALNPAADLLCPAVEVLECVTR